MEKTVEFSYPLLSTSVSWSRSVLTIRKTQNIQGTTRIDDSVEISIKPTTQKSARSTVSERPVTSKPPKKQQKVVNYPRSKTNKK